MVTFDCSHNIKGFYGTKVAIPMGYKHAYTFFDHPFNELSQCSPFELTNEHSPDILSAPSYAILGNSLLCYYNWHTGRYNIGDATDFVVFTLHISTT